MRLLKGCKEKKKNKIMRYSKSQGYELVKDRVLLLIVVSLSILLTFYLLSQLVVGIESLFWTSKSWCC